MKRIFVLFTLVFVAVACSPMPTATPPRGDQGGSSEPGPLPPQDNRQGSGQVQPQGNTCNQVVQQVTEWSGPYLDPDNEALLIYFRDIYYFDAGNSSISCGSQREFYREARPICQYDSRYFADDRVNCVPKPIGYKVTLYISDLFVEDGEEDDYVTSSGQDEIYLIYGFYEVTPGPREYAAGVRSWGVYDLVAGDQYNYQYFESITLEIPLDSGVGVFLLLVEAEDYTAAQQVVAEIDRAVDSIGGAAVTATGGNPKAVAAAEIAKAVTTASGAIVNIISILDSDDLLGEVNEQMASANDLYALCTNNQNYSVDWNFYGTNNSDDYSYYITFQINPSFIYP